MDPAASGVIAENRDSSTSLCLTLVANLVFYVFAQLVLLWRQRSKEGDKEEDLASESRQSGGNSNKDPLTDSFGSRTSRGESSQAMWATNSLTEVRKSTTSSTVQMVHLVDSSMSVPRLLWKHAKRGPVTKRMVKELVKRGGSATMEDFCRSLAERDPNQDGAPIPRADVLAHVISRPEVFRVVKQVNVAANVVAHNYLLFLRLGRNMFVVLTVCAAFIVGTQFGIGPFFMGLTGDLPDVSVMRGYLDKGAIVHLYLSTWTYGIVTLLFTFLFKMLSKEIRATNRDLKRTLWLTELPVIDGQTKKDFELHAYDFERVRGSLEDALNRQVLNCTREDDKVIAEARKSFENVGDTSARLKRRVLQNDEVGLESEVDKLREMCRSVSGGTTPSVVDRMHIALVVDKWYSLWKKVRDEADLLQAYTQQVALLEEQSPGTLWHRLYQRWLRKSEKRQEALVRQFYAMLLREKRMSGSVFVTFKEQRHADAIMLKSAPSCWSGSSHVFFNFGQKPFASVTLRCKRAPHPADVIWENLHISDLSQGVRFWLLSAILVVAMSLLVTPLTLEKALYPVVNLGRYVCDMEIWDHILHEGPAVCLLLINSLLLPVVIDAITDAARNHRRSLEETQRGVLNYWFLVLNIAVTPFVGLHSISELVDTVARGSWDLSALPVYVAMQLQKAGSLNPGLFSLRYIINSTFLSISISELDLSQRIGHSFARRCAITHRGKMDAEEPWAFAWGYWYAYLLSLFVLGLTMSAAVPLVLPALALLCAMKYRVDKQHLTSGTYSLGSAEECTFVPRVLFHMRFAVAMLWVLMGMAFAYYVNQEAVEADAKVELSAMASPLLLIAAGLVTLVWSSAARANMIHKHELGLETVGCVDCTTRCFNQLVNCLRCRGRARLPLREEPQSPSRRTGPQAPTRYTKLLACLSHICGAVKLVVFGCLTRGSGGMPVRSLSESLLSTDDRPSEPARSATVACITNGADPDRLNWDCLPPEKLVAPVRTVSEQPDYTQRSSTGNGLSPSQAPEDPQPQTSKRSIQHAVSVPLPPPPPPPTLTNPNITRW